MLDVKREDGVEEEKTDGADTNGVGDGDVTNGVGVSSTMVLSKEAAMFDSAPPVLDGFCKSLA